MAKAPRYELGVGCLLIVAAGALAFMAVQIGALTGFGDTVDVTVRFPDAAGLQPGAAVTIAGVEIGKVESIALDPTTRESALVSLALDPDAGVRSGAVARIRPRSLLGEKFVELQPGDPASPSAVDGDELFSGGDQIEIDEILTRLGPLLGKLDSDTFGQSFSRFFEKLEKDPELLGRMLDNMDKAMSGAADADLAGLTADARKTMQGVDARVSEAQKPIAQVKQLLTDLPVVVGEARAMMPEFRGMLADGRALIPEMKEALPEVKALLADGRELSATLVEKEDEISLIIDNLTEIDKWELHRLVREEGVTVRFKASEVDPSAEGEPWKPVGKVKKRSESRAAAP